MAPYSTATAVSSRSIADAAERLRLAQRHRRPCPPVRDLIGSNDLAAAYAVQELVAEARTGDGATVVGRKIGLTSPAVQAQLGVDQPDFGLLFDDMAYVGGDTIPASRFLQPRVEAEIAFILAVDLERGDLDLPQVRASVDYAVAALEVCDSRVANWDISFGDTVADNASSGAYVLGLQRRRLADFEPRDVQMRMSVTGQEMSTGTGSACLGDPLVALQWLARQARELGRPLRAGEAVLSGALGPMRPVLPGAVIRADISQLGSVTASFSEDGLDSVG